VEILVGAIILWIVPIFVAHAIGKAKHRAGFLYGLFLGWLGVIIVFVLPTREEMTLDELERKRKNVSPQWYAKKRAELEGQQVYRQCPSCKESMRRDATVCPHCHRESVAWTLHDGRWWTTGPDGGWVWLDELTQEWRSATTG
jgi:hypothetical protein